MGEEERGKRIAALEADIPNLETATKTAENDPSAAPGQRKEMVFSFIVIPDCGAVQSMAIFFAAILAFPARWWKRLAGIVVGVPILYWVNAFRLAILAVIGAYDNGGQWFKFAHEYVWQGIYIVFVVALWMGWVEILVKRRS